MKTQQKSLRPITAASIKQNAFNKLLKRTQLSTKRNDVDAGSMYQVAKKLQNEMCSRYISVMTDDCTFELLDCSESSPE